jgi:hypothetical protein
VSRCLDDVADDHDPDDAASAVPKLGTGLAGHDLADSVVGTGEAAEEVEVSPSMVVVVKVLLAICVVFMFLVCNATL